MNRSDEILQELFHDYYAGNEISTPDLVHKREFGYLLFTGQMVRHNKIDTKFDLNNFLRTVVPRHVYSSAAYYEKPDDRKMLEKKWEGADLIFDLDADHLPGADRMSYEETLEVIKKQTKTLINLYLIDDFGINESDIKLYFSGSRGYHVHVSSESVYLLNGDNRREIADYIDGSTVSIDGFLQVYRSVPLENGGWVRDIYNSIKGIAKERKINVTDSTDLSDLYKKQQSIFKKAIKSVMDDRAVYIDSPVSYDIHRLIRLPGSLHGKSGLIVKEVRIDHIDEFDPLSDAIPGLFLEGNLKIDAREKLDIRLNGEKFSIKTGISSVPAYVAIYMVSSGRATFIE